MKFSWSLSAGYYSTNGPKKTTSGALGLALSAVDKVAGRRARDELENQVDQIAQSKWVIVLTVLN